MVRVDNLPDDRVVIVFRFGDDPKRQYWIVLAKPDVDLCRIDPGYAVDVEVLADLRALARICLGHLEFARAVRTGDIEVTGAPRHRRAIGAWLGRDLGRAVGDYVLAHAPAPR